MMQETGPSFLRNSLSSYAAFLINFLLRLLLYRVVLSTLGMELFGIWGILKAAVLFPMFIQQSFHYAVFLQTARQKERENRIGEALGGVLLFCGLISLLTILFAPEITEFFRIPAQHRAMTVAAFRLSALLFLLDSIAQIFLYVLQGTGRFDLAGLLTSSVSLVNSLCCIALLFFGFQILSLILVDLATTGLLLATAVPAIRKSNRIIFSLRAARIVSFFREAAGQLLLALSGRLLWELDALLIPRFFGIADMTSYWMARRIPHTWTNLMWAGGTPAVTETTSNSINEKIQRIHLLQVSLAIPLAAGLWVFSQSIIALWMGGDYPLAASLMRILVLALAIDFLPSTLMFLLLARGEVFRIVRITLFAAAVKLALSVFAWLEGSIVWLLLSTLAGGVVFSTLMFATGSRRTGIPIFQLLKPVLPGVSASAICIAIFHFMTPMGSIFLLASQILAFLALNYLITILFLRMLFPQIYRETSEHVLRFLKGSGPK